MATSGRRNTGAVGKAEVHCLFAYLRYYPPHTKTFLEHILPHVSVHRMPAQDVLACLLRR